MEIQNVIQLFNELTNEKVHKTVYKIILKHTPENQLKISKTCEGAHITVQSISKKSIKYLLKYAGKI